MFSSNTNRLMGNSQPSKATSIMTYVPILAIAIIVVLIAVFIGVVRKDRNNEQHSKLIEDALWVEQSLSFHLRMHESNLERIAGDISNGANSSSIIARLQHMKSIHPELIQISWSDVSSALSYSYPPGINLPAPENQRPPILKAWLPAYFSPEYQGTLVDLAIPTFNAQNEITGRLRASLSLSQLLTAQVPWWAAEQYEVVLIDNSEAVIARRVNSAATDSTISHSMSVDPPLHGIRLRLTPYNSAPTPMLHLLITVIIGLAALAIVNLLVQHYYARKRLQAEMALRDEQTFRHAMESSMTTGLRARDLQGQILYVNPAFCRLVGRPATEVIGLMPPMPWWVPDVLSETLERHYQQNQAPSSQSFETRFQHSNGSEIDVQVYEAPLINNQGKHVGWMGSIIDISHRKEQEERASKQFEQLQHTARLMTVGEMATTLAHELNQPLAAVASYAAGCLNLLKDPNSDKAMLQTGVEQLAAQNRRAGEIIRRVHDFVRRREPMVCKESLELIINDSLDLVQSDIKKNRITLTAEQPSTPIHVAADRVMIEQVLLNLLRNAIEAVKDLGLNRRHIEITIEVRDQHALIIVSDKGPGVEEAMVAQLFQLFTSTKTHGMGIGLNICRSIIELHRGTLWYEALGTQGATFVFTLPILDA